MKTAAIVAGIAAVAAAAGAPANETICDYYTTALLTDNNATNQQTLLTLVVNTAVIGNYSSLSSSAVPGILTAGVYKGTKVNLLPYFDGALASTNLGGSSGVAVNWLDGGGATPLEANMASNTTDSNQYTLLTHLYEYFAVLLGCSEYGTTVSPYSGFTSMYGVHKYMALSEAEFMYFVEQVGLSAASFGVATKDVDAVGTALIDAFGYRCAAPESIPSTASAAPQAICIDSSCPIATTSAECSLYAAVTSPTSATSTVATTVPVSLSVAPFSSSTSASNSTTESISSYATATTTTAPYSAGAMNLLPTFGAAVVGAAAMLL